MADSNDRDRESRRLTAWIMIGVAIWGVILAIGAYLWNYDYRRPLIVLACVGGFLGLWLAALRRRRPRVADKPSRRD